MIGRKPHGWAVTFPVLAAGLSILATACSAAPAVGLEDLNLEPTSLDEAGETLSQIDELLRLDPENGEALAALAALRPRLDELNHLVARLEPALGHVVSFYEVEPGVLAVSETAPAGEAMVVRGEDMERLSVTELFRSLAGGADTPAELMDAEARQEEAARHAVADPPGDFSPGAATAPDEFESTLSDGLVTAELTGSQGPYFRDNYCFTGGEARGCYPNWGGGGYAQYEAKTSFFTIAPYSGLVSVRFQYEGTTRFTVPAFAGEVQNVWAYSGSYWDCGWGVACGTREYYRRTHRWDILNASGDSFHWTFAARWSCSHFGCDSWPR